MNIELQPCRWQVNLFCQFTQKSTFMLYPPSISIYRGSAYPMMEPGPGFSEMSQIKV